MAITFGETASKAYTTSAILLLSSWSLTALVITALNVMNDKKGFLAPAASVGLLTFLVCRLIAAINPVPLSAAASRGTIAHLIASANYGSRSGAFALFLMTCTWLYQLLETLFVLVLATTIAASVLFLSMFGGPVGEESATEGVKAPEFNFDSNSTALMEFEEKVGVDPTDLLRRFGPYTFFVVMAAVWINFLSLCLYVLGHAAKSFSIVLSTPTQSLVMQQTVVTVIEDGSAPPARIAPPNIPELSLGLQVEDGVTKEKIMIDA